MTNLRIFIDEGYIKKIIRKSPIDKGKFVRPLLTIAAFWIANISLQMAEKSADLYGMEVAKTVQTTCNQQHQCPEYIDGWINAKDAWWNCHTLQGYLGIKYAIRYISKDDRKKFSVEVKHNIDESLWIDGGVDTPISSKKM